MKRNNSAAPVVTAGFTDVALGTLNVINYGDYKFKDTGTVASYATSREARRPVSVETTHGLIRLSCPDAPFVFLSTITDRFTYFDADVSTVPLNDAQNTAAAYNAGIALRWLFANLDAQISAPAPKPRIPPTPTKAIKPRGQAATSDVCEAVGLQDVTKEAVVRCVREGSHRGYGECRG